jgi:HEPN domain-containing protein
MNPLTAEWVEKAEGDFASASRELRARKQPNYDAACFHAQQCAEKYLKAQLQAGNIRFGKTHDLPALLEPLLTLEPAWECLRDDLEALTSYAVEFRYPGAAADKELARSAIKQCSRVRQAVRARLGLEPSAVRNHRKRASRAQGSRKRRRKGAGR